MGSGDQGALNNGLLPPNYYAQVEQAAGAANPDVLTLHTESGNGLPDGGADDETGGATTLAVAPPRVRITAMLETVASAAKRKSLVYHSSDDRIVALVELLSPGNKSSRHALWKIVEKAAAALDQGYHLLLIDFFPPTRRDPQGIHGALWAELGDESHVQPADKPMTLAVYSTGLVKRAYVEPIAVGDSLPDMPLFLDPETYVPVPLEATYQAAYRTVPRQRPLAQVVR